MYQTVTYVNFWIYCIYNNGIILGAWVLGFALSVPIITYLFEIPASLAITYGLFVVGTTSLLVQ